MTGAHKPVRAGGRPPRAAAEKIVHEIIEAAQALFFTHGYGATSIEMIAAAAHISKRTFYHRFENKGAIFRAVVNSLIQSVTPAHVGELFEGLSCEEILHKLAQGALRAALSPQTLALNRLLIAEAPRFPELALIMNEQGARRDALQRIAGLLASEAKAGRLAIADPALAAELFLNMIINLPQRRALGLGKPMTLEETKEWSDNAVHVFLYGHAV